MSQREGEIEASADISNPRDVQGIIAVGTVIGFVVLCAIAAVAIILRGGDPIPILNIVAPLAFGVIAFYFGSRKAAEAAG